MAIAQRIYQEPGYRDEGAIDLHSITLPFRKGRKTLSRRLKVHFKTIDTMLDPDNLIMAAKNDGEWYVGLTALFMFACWDGKQTTVRVPGCKNVVIPNGQAYRKGIDGYQEGYTYVKVSALGLKATLKGDTLVLE